MSRKDSNSLWLMFPARFWRRRKDRRRDRSRSLSTSESHLLALPRTGDPLLDDATAEVGVNQALLGALNGLDQARIADAVPTGKISQASWS